MEYSCIINVIVLIALIMLFVGVIMIVVLSFQIKRQKKHIVSLFQNDIWESFIENADKFTYNHNTQYDNGKTAYVWHYGGYKIIVWYNSGTCSIHSANECVLSTFNKKKSHELAKILMMRYWHENCSINKV